MLIAGNRQTFGVKLPDHLVDDALHAQMRAVDDRRAPSDRQRRVGSRGIDAIAQRDLIVLPLGMAPLLADPLRRIDVELERSVWKNDRSDIPPDDDNVSFLCESAQMIGETLANRGNN